MDIFTRILKFLPAYSGNVVERNDFMIHVCFSVYDETGSFSKFAGTAMLSLFENISRPFTSVTVHILHDKTLTDENRNKFSYIAGHYNQLIKFYNVEELFADKLAEMKNLFPNADKIRLNKAVFYKFLIPQTLPSDIEKIIYLESNVVVNMDIIELWNAELEDKILAVVPAFSISADIPAQDKIVADGFVKKEDYFNSSVMLMNLKLLRGAEEKILAGMKFASEHGYVNLWDQTVLNYCFATQTLKLPTQFNQFVRYARQKKEVLADKIYYYTVNALQLNMNDSFNALWIKYFAKTPWFDAAVLGRLYDGFRQINNKSKKSMINLSAILSGKTRVFCSVPAYVDEVKKIFHVHDDEAVIPLENQASLQKLIEVMKQSQGKKILFVVMQGFPFNVLTGAGLVYGKDFLNGFEFLSEEQGILMNTYPLLYAM